MEIFGDLIALGFLSVLGFGVWQGLGLFRTALSNKHERELSRLQTERQEKSVRLEIEQNRAMAEIEYMKDHPEIAPSNVVVDEVPVAERPNLYVCECSAQKSPHVHYSRGGSVQVAAPMTGLHSVTINVGKLNEACRGDFRGTSLKVDGTPLSELSMIMPLEEW